MMVVSSFEMTSVDVRSPEVGPWFWVQVFATSPCPVQRLLATVVAAEATPCIINGIFSAK